MSAAPSPPPDPLRIWVLSDGAAGNEKQALALAPRLGEVERILQLRPRWPWRWFAPRRLPLAASGFCNEFREACLDPLPDLAIGCGRQAALATRLLRERGVPVVQLLAPRIDARHWDLLIAPAHDALHGANVIQTLGSLHEIDARWLRQARRDWPQIGALPGPRNLLLLGGPTRAAPLAGADWRKLCAKIRRWHDAHGGSLLLSSSRRTPTWLREAARSDLDDLPGLQWHAAEDGSNPYPGLLAWADRIVVSADSVNLISEACATSAPVYVPLLDRPRGRLGAFHRALLASGRVRPLDAEDAPQTVAPLREMDAVVAAVRLRLGLGGGAPPRAS